MKIFLNDRFVDRNEAVVSVFDHGFMYGDGVFETLTSYGGRVFEAPRHIARLFRSAEMLRLDTGMSAERLISLVNEAISINNLENAYIRIHISRGEGEIGLNPALCSKTSVVIYSHEKKKTDIQKTGIKAAVVPVRRNPPSAIDPVIKSTNFLNNILAWIAANDKDAFEGIMLNHEGFLAEGTISNLFFIKNNAVFTPSAEAGILDGITRGIVIEIAKKAGISVNEGLYTPDCLYEADEIFITNTTLEIVPVIRIGERPAGKPGIITAKIAMLYKEYVKSVLELE